MAHTLSVSNRLHKIYNPVDVAAVRVGDAAREVGRSRKSRNESLEIFAGSAESLIFLAGATRLEPAATRGTKFNDFNVSCSILAPGSCSKRQKSCNSKGTGIEARRTPGGHFGDEAEHIVLAAPGIAAR
jgi:hypothetical protein